jgi:hypothetical protein
MAVSKKVLPLRGVNIQFLISIHLDLDTAVDEKLGQLYSLLTMYFFTPNMTSII